MTYFLSWSQYLIGYIGGEILGRFCSESHFEKWFPWGSNSCCNHRLAEGLWKVFLMFARLCACVCARVPALYSLLPSYPVSSEHWLFTLETALHTQTCLSLWIHHHIICVSLLLAQYLALTMCSTDIYHKQCVTTKMNSLPVKISKPQLILWPKFTHSL